MKLGHMLADDLDGSRDWTRKLLADLAGTDWGFQPGPGLAHALWLCGHLACSENLLIHVRALGADSLLDDDFTRHFPIGGPVRSIREHDFPPVEAVHRIMDDVHRQTLFALREVDDGLLAEPCMGAAGKPHPHYRDKRSAVVHCMRHEAFHAGQLAMLRRLLGKPFLR